MRGPQRLQRTAQRREAIVRAAADGETGHLGVRLCLGVRAVPLGMGDEPRVDACIAVGAAADPAALVAAAASKARVKRVRERGGGRNDALQCALTMRSGRGTGSSGGGRRGRRGGRGGRRRLGTVATMRIGVSGRE